MEICSRCSRKIRFPYKVSRATQAAVGFDKETPVCIECFLARANKRKVEAISLDDIHFMGVQATRLNGSYRWMNLQSPARPPETWSAEEAKRFTEQKLKSQRARRQKVQGKKTKGNRNGNSNRET